MTVVSYELRRGSAAEVPVLAPLWLALHHHHQAIAPQLAPYVDDAASWADRQNHYARLLGQPTSALWLAEVDGRPVGYCLTHVVEAAGSWTADTWAVGSRFGEIESLVVLPEHRGQGIGRALLDHAVATLAAGGVTDLAISAVATNAAAIALYERLGFRPTWMYLTRFEGRPPLTERP